jgi:hypothetical protein
MSKTVKNLISNERLNNLHIEDIERVGVEVFKINHYQYRFIKGRRRIDYYITSGKYCDLNLKKWDSIPANKFITLFE